MIGHWTLCDSGEDEAIQSLYFDQCDFSSRPRPGERPGSLSIGDARHRERHDECLWYQSPAHSILAMCVEQRYISCVISAVTDSNGETGGRVYAYIYNEMGDAAIWY